MTIESSMTAPFVTIESHQSPGKAQEMMSDEGVRHLVVREGKTITGLVSIRDLLVFYKSRAEAEYS
jgi:signal-transduction protein with cAMP-binding, CBS, and nucleotidyltransferase domain